MSNNLFTNLNVDLKSSDSELIEKFDNLSDFNDIAKMLELTTNELWIILVRNKSRNYTEVKIPKKNGEERYISIPQNNLLILQKKLKYILELKFYSHFTSHGFVKTKSIVTNALIHQKKNYVINIDIENFFPSIKYNRVVNMFVRYFKLPPIVANTLANIAVHNNGELPQGSPLSPLISNILSKSMDIKFHKLCVALGSVSYTRYADDLTFSTNRKIIPSAIAIYENGEYKIGNELKKIINECGFLINESKFRVQSKFDHQEVTGIKVNKKLNVNKSYIRRVRNFLHVFEVEDSIENAIKQFNMRRKKRFKFLSITSSNKSIIHARNLQSLRGMIEYIGNIRGRRDFIFIKFSKRFNNICLKFNYDSLMIKIPELMEEKLKNNLLHLGKNKDFKYTLNEGLTSQNIKLPNSLAIITKEFGIVSFKTGWENFVLELKNTLYFNTNLIPLYKESDSNLLGYSKIKQFSNESKLMYLEIGSNNFSEDNFVSIDELKIGKTSLLVMQNNTLESFEGEVTKIKIFNKNVYNFIPYINSNIEIKEGFLFNELGNLTAYVEKEDTYFIAKSIK